MKRAIIRIVRFVSLSALLAAPSWAQSSDVSSAGVYFAKAESLYNAGDIAAASDMITTALQFDPDSSEALYLGALISLRSQETTLEGIQRLTKSIQKGTWTRTDPEAGSLTLAGALVRTGRLDEAFPLLNRLAAVKSEDPLTALMLAQAYRKSGKLDLADKTASAARKRFPKNEELYLLSAELATRLGRTGEARQIAATGLAELPDSRRLLLRSLELEPAAAKKLQAVDAYTARGGADPLSAVIALEAEKKDKEKYLALFLSQGGLARVELVRRATLALAGSKAAADSLKKAVAGYTGRRDLDLDSDGFYEERWTYADGDPVSWVKDSNQDGDPEVSAQFVSGSVSVVSYERAGVSTELRYDEYPFLASARQTEGKTARLYLLTPRMLKCSMIEDSSLWTDFSLPTGAEIASAAYRIEESTAGSPVVKISNLSGGAKLYAEEDGDGDGRIDRKIWYSDGKPVAGKRDLTGDGAFALTEVYRDGILRERRADADGDGRAEYAELLDAGTVKMWDYNADGVWDSRETVSGASVVRELSTSFTGAFNLRIEFVGGRISTVRSNGKSVPVTPDAKNGVVWIGTPRTTVPRIPKTDGTVSIGGRLYLVFRFNSTVYVEELE